MYSENAGFSGVFALNREKKRKKVAQDIFSIYICTLLSFVAKRVLYPKQPGTIETRLLNPRT